MCPTLSRAASRAAAFDVGRWLQAGRTQRWGRRGREGPPDRRHERGRAGERLRAVVSARPSSPGERLAVKPGRTPQPGTLCGHPNARHAHRGTETWPGALKCLPRRPFWASFPVLGCRTGPDRADFATKRRSRTRNGRNRRELGPTAPARSVHEHPVAWRLRRRRARVPRGPGRGPEPPKPPTTQSSVIGPSGHRVLWSSGAGGYGPRASPWEQAPPRLSPAREGCSLRLSGGTSYSSPSALARRSGSRPKRAQSAWRSP